MLIYHMSMLEDQRIYEEQAELCQVFSNANRLIILELLNDGEERTVTQIEDRTDIPQPTISQHLAVMREKGVVTRRKDGVRSFYSLADDRFKQGMDTMRSVLLDRMEEVP
ncbi:MAG: ArsR/SmtB family transcription factor [Halodesulfurarchaeum sp.]